MISTVLMIAYCRFSSECMSLHICQISQDFSAPTSLVANIVISPPKLHNLWDDFYHQFSTPEIMLPITNRHMRQIALGVDKGAFFSEIQSLGRVGLHLKLWRYYCLHS